MHNILVNHEKEFFFATILETHKNNYIINRLPENKKYKIKPEQVFYSFDDKLDLNVFLVVINNLIAEIDIELLNEFLEHGTSYHYLELARFNYGDNPTLNEQMSMLLCLAQNLVNFVYLGNGYFRQINCDELQQIQKQLKQKELELAEFESYYQVFSGKNTDLSIIPIDAYRLINKTDKQSIIYKALHKACLEQAIAPLDLCKKIGLIQDIGTYFEDSFIKEFMLNNDIKININLPNISQNIEFNSTINVFSIDDSYTTEIDDALSVQYFADYYIIGIHIAAPALCNDLDEVITSNISTVYSPKLKITMLPKDIIEQFSLDEGQTRPVVSIYFKVNFDYDILDYYLRLENVTIAKNLRIEELERYFNEESITLSSNYPYEKELKLLYQFANILEQKRGKSTTNNFNVDYTFIFDSNNNISLKPRFRGNPIDKLVSELMILANGSFGRILTNAFIPAIYRVKQVGQPVKMMLTPKSHTGLNVDYYTWATSPLRRSVDFINQKQLINLVQNKKAYYSNIHPTLLDVVNNFDTTYNKYINFQEKMERYWSLMYILQENLTHIEATFFYKAQVQLDGLPLTVDLSTQTKPRNSGEKIKLFISNINLLHLTFDIKIIENAL